MRIAHVTATFPPYRGGTGNVAHHDARLLAERGHEVTVFTAALPRGSSAPPAFPFAVEYLPVAFRLGNAPFTPALPRRLAGFELIHLHSPYIFGAELTAAAARRYGTPVVVTHHNDLLSPGWRGAAFTAYRTLVQPRVFRSAARLAATSADYAQHSDLGPWAPRPGGVGVIPNGVDTELFRPGPADPDLLARLGVPAGAPVVIFVGAMDRAHHFKGVPVLLQALAGLPGAHGVLVGEGDLRGEYRRLAGEVAPGRVHFVGGVDLPTLAGLYRGAAVTALPSTTAGEAFGMVLLESMACGTPVVASDLPGVRSVVAEGSDGLLARPGDADELGERLGRLLDDPALRSAMGARGRAKVEARYTWEAVGRCVEEVYGEALAGGRAQPAPAGRAVPGDRGVSAGARGLSGAGDLR